MDWVYFVPIALLLLPIVYFLVSGICEKIAAPHKLKLQLIEKEENNQIDILKKKREELDKEKESLKRKQKDFEDFIAETSRTFEKTCEAEKKRLQEETEQYRQKRIELNQKAKDYIAGKEKELQNQVWKSFSDKIIETIETQYNLDGLYLSIETGRLNNAFDGKLSIGEIIFSAKVISENGKYNTTLKSCDCMDFQIRHIPCKHMLFLAYSIGVLFLEEKKFKEVCVNLEVSIKELSDNKKQLQCEIAELNKKLDNTKRVLEETERVINERAKYYPILAGTIADLFTVHFDKIANHLDSKQRPAHISAEAVRELKKETSLILREKKELEYKMAYIQELFPNINDIFECGFNNEDFELETEETTDRVRFYLSADEYARLSVTERNQLALDNYVAGRKSKWQVGRDYEMYIGHLYEKKGYNVKYTGIIQKLEDMGRDLIAEKGNEVLIIQCKNWAQEKTIHEKHIFQLYGTVIMYSLNSMLNVKGVFVTTTELSPTAKQVAEYLGIDVVENKPLGTFPRIKCNINKADGEKIYHLPFDQQYESTVIDKALGECYAETVKEAEIKGFRRAFKHHLS